MSILNTLKSIKKDDFDPAKDKIGGGDYLESGKYPVQIKKTSVQTTRSGRTQIMVTLEVVSGKDKGRVENVFLSFDPDLPDFVLENNGKYLMKIMHFTNINIESNKDKLEREEDVAELLSQGVGKQFGMDLKVRENKKNPDFPYRNYDFYELQDDPFEQNDSFEEITEADLPF